MYTPSCTASTRRANAAARSSTAMIIGADGPSARDGLLSALVLVVGAWLVAGRLGRARRRHRRVGLARSVGRPLLLDRRADRVHVGAESVHLHRVTRDV